MYATFVVPETMDLNRVLDTLVANSGYCFMGPNDHDEYTVYADCPHFDECVFGYALMSLANMQIDFYIRGYEDHEYLDIPVEWAEDKDVEKLMTSLRELCGDECVSYEDGRIKITSCSENESLLVASYWLANRAIPFGVR